MELLCQLAPGLAAAHDDDTARREARLVSVPPEVQLVERRGQHGRGGRAMGLLERARAEHHEPGGHVALRGVRHEAGQGGVELVDRDAFTDRGIESAGVGLQVGDDGVARHEAVGVVALVLPTGQPDGPVRGHQAEAVPAVAPRLAERVPLHDQVLDAVAGQLVAHRQAGRAAADDQHIDALHGGAV